MTYDLGATVPLLYYNYDDTGTLANASGGAVITVALPDGTTQTPTVSNAVVGAYTAFGPSTLAGRYTVDYVSSGVNSAAVSDMYDVRAQASISLLSLTDARKALNWVKTVNNEELRDYMDAVTRIIENYIGPVIPRTFTEVIQGTQVLELTYRPVTAIASITGFLTGAWTISMPNVVWDQATGQVQLANRYGFYDTYTVVYTAGWGISDDIVQAARVTLAHLWANQRNMMGGNPEAQGPGYGLAFTLPAAAREALNGKRTPAVG